MPIKRSLFLAAAIIAPLALGGCVVAPDAYYSNPGYYNGQAYYTGPAVYGPSVYVSGGGCCYHGRYYHGWHGGGGYARGGWRR